MNTKNTEQYRWEQNGQPRVTIGDDFDYEVYHGAWYGVVCDVRDGKARYRTYLLDLDSDSNCHILADTDETQTWQKFYDHGWSKTDCHQGRLPEWDLPTYVEEKKNGVIIEKWVNRNGELKNPPNFPMLTILDDTDCPGEVICETSSLAESEAELANLEKKTVRP